MIVHGTYHLEEFLIRNATVFSQNIYRKVFFCVKMVVQYKYQYIKKIQWFFIHFKICSICSRTEFFSFCILEILRPMCIQSLCLQYRWMTLKRNTHASLYSILWLIEARSRNSTVFLYEKYLVHRLIPHELTTVQIFLRY